MRQVRKNKRLFLIAFCAAIFCSLTLGEVIELVDPGTTEPVAQRPPKGIRSYGPGAVVKDRATIEPGRSPSQRGPENAGGTKLSGTPMAGAVNVFALTPDGATAVYIAEAARSCGDTWIENDIRQANDSAKARRQ